MEVQFCSEVNQICWNQRWEIEIPLTELHKFIFLFCLIDLALD